MALFLSCAENVHTSCYSSYLGYEKAVGSVPQLCREGEDQLLYFSLGV